MSIPFRGIVKRLIVLTALCGLATLGWYSLQKTAASELVLYGNIDQRQVEPAFADAERVAEVLVREGDVVAPGQALARLETRRLQDQLAAGEAEAHAAEATLGKLRNGTRPEEKEQARAGVALAEAELVYATQQFERSRTLLRKSGGAVSQQDMDAARMQRNVAEAKLKQQRNSLKLAELGPRQEDIDAASATLNAKQASAAVWRTRLDEAVLRSPAHAVVSARLLEPGDMASPQRPVFSLLLPHPKWARVYVAETDLGLLRPGLAALVYSDTFPDEPVPGTVGFIGSVAEFTPKTVQTPELRTALVYEVRVMVEDPDNRLRLGMPVTVRFPDAVR